MHYCLFFPFLFIKKFTKENFKRDREKNLFKYDKMLFKYIVFLFFIFINKKILRKKIVRGTERKRYKKNVL